MSAGQLIANRFELQNLLDRAGMGEVYRAMDTQTGETVAVKAFYPVVIAHGSKLFERIVCELKAKCEYNQFHYLELGNTSIP